MRTTNVTLALLVALCGCAVEGDPGTATGETDRSIIGGLPDSEFPAACIMDIALPPDDDGNEQDPIVCSCSLVGEGIVLTSARCVEQNTPAADATAGEAEALLAGIEVRFGIDRSADPIPVAEVELYRYFDPDDAASEDLALVRLTSTPAAVEPVVLNTDALTDADIGSEVTLVGYGVRDPASETSTGSRNAARTTITAVNPNHILAGSEEITSCAGDSGGPIFVDRDGQQVQIAVTAYQDDCSTNVRRLRVDHYFAEFLDAYLRRFTGPCPADDTCDEACEQVDPDCEPCDWNGECATDCPTRDWDCELGSFAGDACEGSGDCEEGGRCIPAADDESFTFCSRPCDPAGVGPGCPSGMECSDLGDGSGECAWLTPSPGSQGFACSDETQCRSSICEDGICVFSCNPGDASACDEPYVCGPSKVVDGMNVCLGEDLSGGGGFCAVSPAGSNAGGHKGAFLFTLLSVLGMVFILRRR